MSPCVCPENLSPGDVFQGTYAPPTSFRVKNFKADIAWTTLFPHSLSHPQYYPSLKHFSNKKHKHVIPNLVAFDDIDTSRDFKCEQTLHISFNCTSGRVDKFTFE